MRAGSFIRRFPLALAALAIVASAGAAHASGGPSCEITGPDVACGPVELCGPEGNYDYYWAPPNGGVQFTRCILASDEGAYVLWITDRDTGLQGEPCFKKLTINPPTSCLITGPDDFCEGSKAELCGPEGSFAYSWTGPGDFTSTDRCIDVSVAGTYVLTVSNPDGSCPQSCKHDLSSKVCIVNCPRTVGFWGAQCAQKKGGSTKFTKDQVTSIAQCVDAKASAFNWGANAFSGFCATISTTDMNQRVQAKRQFAGLLANVCTGEMGLIANNGDQIRLSTETIVTCGGVTQTIGDLIASIDAQLVTLEGQNIALSSVKDAYSAIITCADGINNGLGIGPVCPELAATVTTSTSTSASSVDLGASQQTLEPGALRAFPNPFKSLTHLAYAVAPQGENVSLGVYDIAGRQVKNLFDGFQSGGVHVTSWDGTDAAGSRTRAGMYFIRGRVGDRPVASRVMLVE